jgi:hypothetical protein
LQYTTLAFSYTKVIFELIKQFNGKSLDYNLDICLLELKYTTNNLDLIAMVNLVNDDYVGIAILNKNICRRRE